MPTTDDTMVPSICQTVPRSPTAYARLPLAKKTALILPVNCGVESGTHCCPSNNASWPCPPATNTECPNEPGATSSAVMGKPTPGPVCTNESESGIHCALAHPLGHGVSTGEYEQLPVAGLHVPVALKVRFEPITQAG